MIRVRVRIKVRVGVKSTGQGWACAYGSEGLAVLGSGLGLCIRLGSEGRDCVRVRVKETI